MKNPFLSLSVNGTSEYLTSRCSLNRAILSKLPLYGIDDEIEGRAFKDIFSTPLIVEEIRSVSGRYGLDFSSVPDQSLPMILDEALVSDDVRYRQMAHRVVKKFGSRLGLLLLTLKRGEEANRLARCDWDDACWQYWNKLETVILTGGLASSMLGRRFKEYIHTVFDIAGEKPYNIMLFDNGRYLGLMGVAQRLMPEGSASLVLDMGQTNFKRALVRKRGGEISEFVPLESLPSLHMRNIFDSDKQRLGSAVELHRYLVKSISGSFRSVDRSDLSETILISIANYTHDGFLDSVRGGYSKLSMLGAPYSKVLEEDLSSELHKAIRVRLIHDGTATAMYFSDIENAVCVTMGTAFGVGFPDINV